MTEIKNEPLGSNSSNSSKAGTKNYKLWGKYKNSYFNAQGNDQKKTETGGDLTLKGRELCWEKFIFIRLLVRGHSQVARHQVARTQAKSHGLEELDDEV